MKEIRKIIKLILTTNMTNKEISDYVEGTSTYIINLIRQKLMVKKCDWQKVKAMSDTDFKKLLRTKCPRFVKRVFPDVDYMKHPTPHINPMLQEIWKEYCRA